MNNKTEEENNTDDSIDGGCRQETKVNKDIDKAGRDADSDGDGDVYCGGQRSRKKEKDNLMLKCDIHTRKSREEQQIYIQNTGENMA